MNRDNEQLGVMPTQEARELAFKEELDLVETVPHAKPPVCVITDYQKYKYQQKIKEKEEKRKHKAIQPKEIQLRYCTEEHDLQTKINLLKGFLEEKRNVKLVMKFKNRELTFKDKGLLLFTKMLESVVALGKLESPPKLEGKNIIAKVIPLSTTNN